jgi:hypothetical protein
MDQRGAEGPDELVEVAVAHLHREEERHGSMDYAAAVPVPVVLGLHGHDVEAHTAPEAAAAPQELHLVDAPAEGPSLGRAGMARGQGPCAKAGPGCDLAVAEEHVPVRYRAEGAEEPELGTDRDPKTSN